MIEKEIIKRYKEHYTTYIKRTGAGELLQWMENNGFFEAPASCRHHGSQPGGLAEHSLNVFNRMLWIAEGGIKTQRVLDRESIAIVSLLHDLCKMDAYRLVEEGETRHYEVTRNFPAGHGEKSVILILQFMHLTQEEILAIRWHMGQYDFYARGGGYDLGNAFHQCKLAVMLHLADMMATYLDETEG